MSAPEKPEKERPRCHHYMFAHMALRQVAYSNPLGCLGVLASPNATAFLKDLWQDVDKLCRERGETSTIQPSEFVIYKLCVGKYPCAIVEMPEPWFITGAHFIAILVRKPLDQIGPEERDAPMMYYTLEKTINFDDDTPQTVLCSWTKEGTHSNFGPEPQPELHAFVKELQRRESGQNDDPPHASFRPGTAGDL
jgi:hypothetical protein